MVSIVLSDCKQHTHTLTYTVCIYSIDRLCRFWNVKNGLVYGQLYWHFFMSFSSSLSLAGSEKTQTLFETHKSVYYRRHIIFWCKNWIHIILNERYIYIQCPKTKAKNEQPTHTHIQITLNRSKFIDHNTSTHNFNSNSNSKSMPIFEYKHPMWQCHLFWMHVSLFSD